MYKIKDKKSLLRLLKQHDLKGHGGIFLEDIQESLPHCEKHLKVNYLNYGNILVIVWIIKSLNGLIIIRYIYIYKSIAESTKWNRSCQPTW